MTAERAAVILGGNSLVAAPLIERLTGAGYDVQVLGRTRPACLPADRPQVAWRRFDVTAASLWTPPAGAAVFSLLPLWLLPHLLPRLGQAGHLVAFSSASVLAYRDSSDPAERRLARRLDEAEQRLRSKAGELGLGYTILRPTIIYGGGAESGLSTVVRWIDRLGVFPLAGPAHGIRQPVHAADLAEAAIAVLGRPGARNQTFALGGGQLLRFRRMVEMVITGSGRHGRVVALPPALLKAAFGIASMLGLMDGTPGFIDRMNVDQQVSNEAARRAFGYAPRPFEPRPADFPPARTAAAALRPSPLPPR